MRMKMEPEFLPKEGDKRTIKKFAFLPVQIKNYLVWWEYYTVKQSYTEDDYIGFNSCAGWSTIAKKMGKKHGN